MKPNYVPGILFYFIIIFCILIDEFNLYVFNYLYIGVYIQAFYFKASISFRYISFIISFNILSLIYKIC